MYDGKRSIEMIQEHAVRRSGVDMSCRRRTSQANKSRTGLDMTDIHDIGNSSVVKNNNIILS